MSVNNPNAPAAAARQANFSQLDRGPRFDPAVLDNVLIDAPISLLPRVLTQTPAPGQVVPQGTAVNITLAPADKIPIEIFTDVLPIFHDLTIGQITTGVLTHPKVNDVVLTGLPASSLTATQREDLKAGLRASQFEVDDASLDQALTTLRNAALFK